MLLVVDAIFYGTERIEKMPKRLRFSFFVAIYLSANLLFAQNEKAEKPGSIRGFVKYENVEWYPQKFVRLCAGRMPDYEKSPKAEVGRDGMFVFNDVTPGDYYLASPYWEGHYVEVNAGQTSEVRIVFGDDLFEAKGTVHWQGQPMTGGEMSILPIEPGMDRYFWPIERIPVKIHEDGTFKVTLIEGGTYSFIVTPPRPRAEGLKPGDKVIPPIRFEVFEDIEPNGEPLKIEMPIQRVAGKYVTRDSELFPDDHIVCLIPTQYESLYDPEQIVYCSKINNGDFAFNHMTSGQYDMLLMQNPYAFKEDNLGPQYVEYYMVEAKGDSTNRAYFRPWPVCNIAVSTKIETNAAQNPLITLIKQDNWRITKRFALNDVKNFEQKLPEGTYWLIVSANDPYVSASVHTIAANKDQNVEAKLLPAGIIKVRLRSESKEIAGRLLNIRTTDGKAVFRLDDPMQAADVERRNLIVLPTDQTGRTEIQSLPEGDYIIGIEGRRISAPVSVKAGEDTQVVIDIP